MYSEEILNISKIDSLTTYIYCPKAALFNYGHFHPMKPIRMAMANHILSQIPHNMNILEVTEKETNRFFENINDNFLIKLKEPYKYSICDLNNPNLFNDDSPKFEGCDEFIKLYTTTSLCAGEIALIKLPKIEYGRIYNINKYKEENIFNQKIFYKNNLIKNYKEKIENRNFKKHLMMKRFENELFINKDTKQFKKSFIDEIMGSNFSDKIIKSSNYFKIKQNKMINKLKSYNINDPIFNKTIKNEEIFLPIEYKESNQSDQKLIINYSGGLHHGRKSNFDGFCYVNDIVHLINLLLSGYNKVLYVDIDIHHGDGVEEAFRFNSNVHTLSIHRYGDFFPYTGSLVSNTSSTTNVPLLRGTTDTYYLYILEPIIKSILNTFKPSICVIQCGGDSLAEDLLGDFNITMKGHRKILLKILDEFYNGNPNGKCILLGGGGYSPKNVARTWAYESLFLSKYVDSKFNYKSNLNKYGGNLSEIENIFDLEIKKFNVDLFGETIPIIKKLKHRGINENKKPYLDNILSYILQVLDPRV